MVLKPSGSPRLGLLWAAFFLVVLAVAGVIRYGWLQPERTVNIEASWGFDLADPELVFGYSHFVILGRVEQILESQDDSTLFLVKPLDEIKGSVPETVKVAQTGFRRGNVTFELREQPLLEVGKSYLLGLTVPGDASDVLTVVAGSVSGQRWNPGDEAAKKEAREEAAHSSWPPEFGAPASQQRHELHAIAWTTGRPGYRAEPPTLELPLRSTLSR